MSAGTSTIGAGNSMPQTPDNGEDAQVKDEDDVVAIQDEDPNELIVKHAQLRTLLEKSSVYAQLIGDRMRRQRADKAQEAQNKERQAHKQENAKSKAAIAQANGRRTATRLAAKKDGDIKEEPKVASHNTKRKRDSKTKNKDEQGETGFEDEVVALAAVAAAAAADGEEGDAGKDKDRKVYVGEQPALITGATLRDYQLAGTVDGQSLREWIEWDFSRRDGTWKDPSNHRFLGLSL